MIKQINYTCQLASILLASLETLLVLQGTWFEAYFNGLSTGTYRVIVYINNWGEAVPELYLWFIMTPVIIYGSLLNIIMVYNAYEHSKNIDTKPL